MFGIGLPELFLILALALIVLGPDKLPETARKIAKIVGDLRRTTEELKRELELEALDDLKELKRPDYLLDKFTVPPDETGASHSASDASCDSGDNSSNSSERQFSSLGPEWKEAKKEAGSERKLDDVHGAPDAEGKVSRADVH